MIKRTSFVDSILSSISSKEQQPIDVIIEFGSKVIKIGYSYECKPRFIIESDYTTLDGKRVYYFSLLKQF